MTFAHAVGAGGLPFPVWVLAYGLAAVVALTAVALRTSWPRPLLRTPLTGDDAPGAASATPSRRLGASTLLGRAVGLLLFLGVTLLALLGPATAATNIAPVAVTVVWWVGLPLTCLVVGDVFAWLAPFDSIAAGAERATRRGRVAPATRGGSAPSWTAAAFLCVFGWYWLAYHRPGSSRALAVLLLAYAVAAVAGALRWGRSWLRHGEGFAALSAAVASLGLRARTGAVSTGLVALAVVWLGGTAFDAISSTGFWIDVLGTSSGWGRTLLNTIGLVWVTAIVGAAVLLAERLGRSGAAAESTDPAGEVLARALVPLALGWFVAHDLTLLLFEGQNFLALASDPLSRGWDLFGTVRSTIDYGIVDAGWVQATQIGFLAAGHLGAVLVTHDAALRRTTRRRAAGITAAAATLAVVSAVVSTLLILGGD